MVLLSVVMLCLSVFTPAVANAGLAPESTTILVTTLTDELNSDGDCALREAIRAANLDQAVDACAAGSGADTIVLQGGVTYTLTRAGVDDTAILGDLDITDDLTLIGSNAIINANGAVTNDRVIQVLSGNVVTISSVTLRNGRTSSFGAGVRNAGTLTLRSVTISDNQSTGNAGGGLAQRGGRAVRVRLHHYRQHGLDVGRRHCAAGRRAARRQSHPQQQHSHQRSRRGTVDRLQRFSHVGQ